MNIGEFGYDFSYLQKGGQRDYSFRRIKGSTPEKYRFRIIEMEHGDSRLGIIRGFELKLKLL